ncbi:hypothetical protein EL26_19500 [Tumebacillus flagellatus]|uniref:Uncharacterized protein n=1 Tax=Tumebacillus flagellatus TaxID=1157490 RepID=A0A074LMD0_9BACL|nr:hypothetical protein EL26_19500 [Tumebacillus flagellatus]
MDQGGLRAEAGRCGTRRGGGATLPRRDPTAGGGGTGVPDARGACVWRREPRAGEGNRRIRSTVPS